MNRDALKTSAIEIADKFDLTLFNLFNDFISVDGARERLSVLRGEILSLVGSQEERDAKFREDGGFSVHLGLPLDCLALEFESFLDSLSKIIEERDFEDGARKLTHVFNLMKKDVRHWSEQIRTL